jgi:hypothetical protein
MCTAVLLCREEFGGNVVNKDVDLSYAFVDNLLASKNVSTACKDFLRFDFSFDKYDLGRDATEPKTVRVDVMELLKTWKLNYETEDYSSVLMRKVCARMKPTSLNKRIFSAVVALMNSREFLEHLDKKTTDFAAMSSSRILYIARDFQGACFTNSFDLRTFHLSPAQQATRKVSRMSKILELELGRDINLKGKSWRKKHCIENRKKYGSLLGKNAGAILTMVVGSGGYGGTKGVLPGPGAKSGYAFVTGEMLGTQGDSSCNGILSQEFDASIKAYNKMQLRWRKLSYEFRLLAKQSISEREQVFWTRLADRLVKWSSDDHYRIQFRFCEFGKIGGIVCRNAGRKRAWADFFQEGETDNDVDVHSQKDELPEVDSASENTFNVLLSKLKGL